VKLTLQKFYRINGGSTQLKGVIPDIIVPDQYEYLKFREKDNPDALPWDEIQKANYGLFNGNIDVAAVKNASIERINSSQAFNAIKENSSFLAKINDKEHSLNITKYREEQKEIRAALKKVEGLNKTDKELDIQLLPQDENKLSADKDKLERRKQWVKNLRTDIYLNETVNVITDLVKQSSVAKSN
jgi:carboxyl-terminal processing protease